MDYFQFKTKELRDLAWLIRSPFIISDFDEAFNAKHYQLMEDKLKYWDKKPSDLYAALGQLKSPYLGHYFEKLMLFWLQNDDSFRVLAHNKQIKEEGRTIGEIDFLLERDSMVEHWEVAIKFYLGTKSGKDQYDWVGPNPRDQLGMKLDKIRKQQLQLTDTEAAKPFLQKLNIEQVEKRVFVKGNLYYPLAAEIESPEGVSEFHNRSWWIYDDQMHLLPKGLQLAEKVKRHWISPDTFSEEDLIRKDRIPKRLLSRKLKKPQLYALVAETEEGLREQSSGFIAPRNWPETI